MMVVLSGFLVIGEHGTQWQFCSHGFDLAKMMYTRPILITGSKEDLFQDRRAWDCIHAIAQGHIVRMLIIAHCHDTRTLRP